MLELPRRVLKCVKRHETVTDVSDHSNFVCRQVARCDDRLCGGDVVPYSTVIVTVTRALLAAIARREAT